MFSLSEVQQRAKAHGLADLDQLDKTGLIQAIQIKEGYHPCFGASWCVPCKYDDCLWKEDCRAIKFGA
jgi:hypothetical protein